MKISPKKVCLVLKIQVEFVPEVIQILRPKVSSKSLVLEEKNCLSKITFYPLKVLICPECQQKMDIPRMCQKMCRVSALVLSIYKSTEILKVVF
jgi:hypothetical protein